MTIQQFRDILVEIDGNVKVTHGFALNQTGDYLVWERLGVFFEYADNSIATRTQKIKLYYFTKSEYPTYPKLLEDTLVGYDEITISAQKEECDYDLNTYCYFWDVEMELF